MQLDPRSITVMTALMAAVLGLVLLGVRRNYPSTIHGLLPWAMAPMTCAFAAGVYALQGLWPEFVVAQTGNALLLTGCGLFYFGSQRFFGRPVSWRLWGAIALLSLAVLTWFLIRPDYRVRMVVFTGTMTACVLAHARLVLRDGRGFAAGPADTVFCEPVLDRLYSAKTRIVRDADGAAVRFLATPDQR